MTDSWTFVSPLASTRGALITAMCSGDCPTEGVVMYGVRSKMLADAHISAPLVGADFFYVDGTYDACVEVTLFLHDRCVIDARQMTGVAS